MLRIDAFPPAVAVPPLQEAAQSLRPAIHAAKVVESAAISGAKAFHQGSLASDYSNHSVSAQSQMLTYSRDGAAGTSTRAVSGRLLNIYA